jgi:hypothetical protein
MSKRGHDCGVVCNQMSIKISKPKKTLNVMDRSWGSPIHNGLNLMIVHVYTIFRIDVAKEFHFSLMKFTFFQLGIKSNFPELVQNK